MSLKKHLLHGGMGSIIVRVIGTGLAFLLSVVLARLLGAEGYGVYSFVLSILIFLSIPIQSGFPNLAVRETAKAHQAGEWGKIKGMWLWTVRLIFFYSLSLILLLIITEILSFQWLNEIRYSIFLIGFILIPLTAILITQGAIIRGLNRVVIGIIPDAIIRPGLSLLLVLSITYFLSPELITPYNSMLIYISSMLLAFIVSLIMMFLLTPVEHRNMNVFHIEAKKWKEAAYPLTIVGGLQLMYGYSDVIILGFFQEDKEVGIYRAIGQLGTLVIFGLSAINQMLHPHFSRLYAAKEIKKLQKVVTLSSLVIFGFAAIPALIFLVWGEFILDVIFGEEFKIGYLPLSILTIGQLANASFGSVGALLNMTGHEKDAMKGMFYSLFINIVLAFALIPPYGMEGAALATAISLVVWNIILRFYVKKRLNIESIGYIQIVKQRSLI